MVSSTKTGSGDFRPLIERFLAVTQSAVRAVTPGMLKAHEAPTRESWVKSDGSLVTATDLEVERVFTEAIAREFPGMPVIAEESEAARINGFSGRPQDFYASLLGEPHLIIIDPLDGTKNFVLGHKEFCIAAALTARVGGGVWPIAGVVAIPTEDRMLWSDGERVSGEVISSGAALTVAQERTGAAEVSISSRDRRWLDEQGLVLRQPWVSSGSSVYDMAGTLTGKLRASVVGSQRLWDLVAPLALARPLGLELRDLLTGKSVSAIAPDDLSQDISERPWGLMRRLILAPPDCAIGEIVSKS
jgi:fructose-1,6-bisphosphatase/inositol monophosphatase family enzyme